MDLFVQMVPYLFRYLPEYVSAYRMELVQIIATNADPTHVRTRTTHRLLTLFGPRREVSSFSWLAIMKTCRSSHWHAS
jgi:hypothetical protein